MQIEFHHLLLPIYHHHRPPANFHNRCRNIYSNRRSQSFCKSISWSYNSTWHIHTFVKKFSRGAQFCYDFHRCPRGEKKVMLHQCQSASTPALGIHVCLNPLHLSSVSEQAKFVSKVKWLQMFLAIGCLIRLPYATFSVVCYRKLCRNSIRCKNLTSLSVRSMRNIFCSKGRLSTYWITSLLRRPDLKLGRNFW